MCFFLIALVQNLSNNLKLGAGGIVTIQSGSLISIKNFFSGIGLPIRMTQSVSYLM